MRTDERLQRCIAEIVASRHEGGEAQERRLRAVEDELADMAATSPQEAENATLKQQVIQYLQERNNARAHAVADQAENTALKAQVEQLCGDVRAAVEDYSNARQQVERLTEHLQSLLVSAESYVKVSRFRGEDLREEAAHDIRNKMASARALLEALAAPSHPQEAKARVSKVGEPMGLSENIIVLPDEREG